MILKYQYTYRKKDSLGRWRLQKHFVSIKTEEKPGTITPQGYKLENLEYIWLCNEWNDVFPKIVYSDVWKIIAESQDKYMEPRLAKRLTDAIEYTSKAGFLELTAKLLDYAHILGLENKTENQYKL